MNKVFIFLLFGFFNLSALDWSSYEDAIKLQKQNSKIIMIDVVRTHCQYCIKMEKEVFKDKEMSKWVQERFIAVKVNLDLHKMPLNLKIQMTPTFYFLDKNQNILKKIPGSWNIQDFKELTQNIKDKIDD